MSLSGKKIVLGISSSIAAFKSIFIVRSLIKQNAEVKVILTPSAKNFVTPLTLSTLSRNEVYVEFENNKNIWYNHVELGLWADAILIAPATANTIASMANGICTNFLMATYLSARCKTFFAPAMDLDMLNQPSTQKNIQTLVNRGNILIESEYGELASGLNGNGRMAEPDSIIHFLNDFFLVELPLNNIKILITAGPTHEYIDSVRFIGNASSGKMGFALAEKLANLGADVTIVSGPVSITSRNNSIKIIKVNSAEEMFNAAIVNFDDSLITVCTAAVADYMPKTRIQKKLKKSGENLVIELIPTPDILAHLGTLKKSNQLLIGFSLEVENEVENAHEKMIRKNCDLMVLNSLNDEGAGFNSETNKITLLDRHNKIEKFPLKQKMEVANDISNKILEKFFELRK